VLIAIVSDTHLPRGTRAIPPRCWELMAGSDLIIHAGDFTSEAVLSEIESLGPPVRAVHGNMDSQELRRRLPAETLVRCEGATIAVVHDGGPAAGRPERLRRLFGFA
jgi:putative phosphoesterase